MKFDVAKVRLYRHCHFAHHLRFERGLSKKDQPLSHSDIIRKIISLEALCKQHFKKPLRELPPDEAQAIKDIMSVYFKTQPSLKLRYVDKKLKIKIAKGIYFSDTIAGLTKHKKSTYLVVNKISKRVWNTDQLYRNMDVAVYIEALKQMGLPVPKGVCFNFILTNAPKVPMVLKNGKLSQADILTLPPTINRVFKQSDFIKKDYTFLVKNAQECIKKFFNRVYVPLNSNLVKE
jgi:hypothetical protein